MSTNGVRNSNIDHVSVKIPSFFANTILWFKQVEASFNLGRITEETTKYFHLISSLPVELLTKFEHLLDSTSSDPYTSLKTAIIKEYNESKKTSIDDLLKDTSLGDRSPSDVLREIRQNIRRMDPSFTNENSPIIRDMFFRTLPINIQQSLLCQPDNDLETLAQFADKIMRLSKQNQWQTQISQCQNEDSTKLDAIDQLRIEVNALRRSIQKRSDDQSMCFYHRTFGYNARKCVKPCSWRKEDEHKDQGNGLRLH